MNISKDTEQQSMPPSAAIYMITSVFLLLVVIGTAVPYGILNAIGIIDAPAAIALPLFRQQSTIIILAYYSLALSGILLIPLVILLQAILTRVAVISMSIACTFGVLGGVMLALGEVRWPFLLPYLTNTYLDAHASEATHAAITIVYQAVDQYAGVAIGENLSFLLIGIWSLLISLKLLRFPFFQAWIGWVGIFVAICLFVSCLEQFDLNVGPVLLITLIVSRIGWAFWLIVIAVVLLRHRGKVIYKPVQA